MSKILVILALIGTAVADCQSTVLSAVGDPNFGWVLSGTDPDAQAVKLNTVCTDSTARANFRAVLNNLQTNCASLVPAGSTGPSSLKMMFDLLDSVLCTKIDNDYCAGGLLTMLDLTYLLGVQTAVTKTPPETPSLPNVTEVAKDPKRFAAMCKSDLCSMTIQSQASTFNGGAMAAALPGGASSTDFTKGAIDWITKLVSSMRCTCYTVQGKTCYTDANAQLKDANGLVLSKACVGGELQSCAKLMLTCDNLPQPPPCDTPTAAPSNSPAPTSAPSSAPTLANAPTNAPSLSVAPTQAPVAPTIAPSAAPCTGYAFELSFKIQNLNRQCFFALSNSKASELDLIYSDLTTNLLGIAKADFDCYCDNNQDPFVACDCDVCADKSTLDENKLLARFLAYSQNSVILTNALDASAATCKIDAAQQTYGANTKVTVVLSNGAESLYAGGAVLALVVGLLF